MGITVRLYIKAQNKLMFINWLPFVSNFTNATILYKFYDKSMTSDALILSYDLALMDIPIDAYCRHGISFNPI